LKRHITSIPIKGVTSTSQPKGNRKSRVNEQSHSRRRPYPPLCLRCY